MNTLFHKTLLNMFALEIRERQRAHMVANQSAVHFWFLRLQLLSDHYSTLDGKLLYNKLVLQHLITIPIHLDIFFKLSCAPYIFVL